MQSNFYILHQNPNLLQFDHLYRDSQTRQLFSNTSFKLYAMGRCELPLSPALQGGKKKKKTVAVVFGSVCALRGGVCRGTEFVSLSGWGKKMLVKCSSPDFNMCCSGWVQHCQERRENKMWCRTRQHFQKWGAVSSGVCWWAVVLQWSKKHWNEIHVLCEVLSSAAAENGEAE